MEYSWWERKSKKGRTGDRQTHEEREEKRQRQRDEERRGGARVCEQERDRGKVPLNMEPIP